MSGPSVTMPFNNGDVIMHPMEMTAGQVEWVGRSFADNLDYIPEDKFDWNPEPAAKSAREIVAHTATILQGAIGVAGGGSFEPKPVIIADRVSAQQLVRRLATEHAAALRALT